MSIARFQQKRSPAQEARPLLLQRGQIRLRPKDEGTISEQPGAGAMNLLLDAFEQEIGGTTYVHKLELSPEEMFDLGPGPDPFENRDGPGLLDRHALENHARALRNALSTDPRGQSVEGLSGLVFDLSIDLHEGKSRPRAHGATDEPRATAEIARNHERSGKLAPRMRLVVVRAHASPSGVISIPS